MSLALTRQELSFQRRVRAFTEKHLKSLAAKIEAEEYFPSDFLGALGRNTFLGAPFSRSSDRALLPGCEVCDDRRRNQ
jgi:alkylation response protein AidB-like acyl-CoA dehydrogenase